MAQPANQPTLGITPGHRRSDELLDRLVHARSDPRNGARPGCRVFNCEDVTLARIVRKHHHDFISHAIPLTKDEHLAEDVVQEVYRRALPHEDALELEESAIVTYIKQGIRNEVRHVRRRAKNEQTALEEVSRNPLRSPPPTPAEDQRCRDVQNAVRTAVADLSPRQRAAVTLVRLEGMSYKDAAISMDCAVRTVETHLRLAETSLRQRPSLKKMRDMYM